MKEKSVRLPGISNLTGSPRVSVLHYYTKSDEIGLSSHNNVAWQHYTNMRHSIPPSV
jgi:hypothetical protein